MPTLVMQQRKNYHQKKRKKFVLCSQSHEKNLPLTHFYPNILIKLGYCLNQICFFFVCWKRSIWSANLRGKNYFWIMNFLWRTQLIYLPPLRKNDWKIFCIKIAIKIKLWKHWKDIVQLHYCSIIEDLQKFCTKIKKRLQRVLVECQKEDRVPEELRHLLTESKSLSNSDTVNKIKAFLEDKYDQKHWLVIVYDAVSGFDKHYLSG